MAFDCGNAPAGQQTKTPTLGEDGGTDLLYYGMFNGLRWPAAVAATEARASSLSPFATGLLAQLTGQIDAHWFVVTNLGDLDKQVELRTCLESRFSLSHGSREEGYLIFDLKRPVAPPPW